MTEWRKNFVKTTPCFVVKLGIHHYYFWFPWLPQGMEVKPCLVLKFDESESESIVIRKTQKNNLNEEQRFYREMVENWTDAFYELIGNRCRQNRFPISHGFTQSAMWQRCTIAATDSHWLSNYSLSCQIKWNELTREAQPLSTVGQ